MSTKNLKKHILCLLFCSLSLQGAFQLTLDKAEARAQVSITKKEEKIFESLIAKSPSEVVKLLKKPKNKEVNINKLHTTSYRSLLDFASVSKDESLKIYLLNHPTINLSMRYYEGWLGKFYIYSPFVTPCQYNLVGFVEKMVAHKNFNHESFAGVKVIQYAILYPLFTASAYGRLKILYKLLSPRNFFNINIKTIEGKTPWDEEWVCKLYQEESKEEIAKAIRALPEKIEKERYWLAQSMTKKYAPLLLLIIPTTIYKMIENFI